MLILEINLQIYYFSHLKICTDKSSFT